MRSYIGRVQSRKVHYGHTLDVYRVERFSVIIHWPCAEWRGPLWSYIGRVQSREVHYSHTLAVCRVERSIVVIHWPCAE